MPDSFVRTYVLNGSMTTIHPRVSSHKQPVWILKTLRFYVTKEHIYTRKRHKVNSSMIPEFVDRDENQDINQTYFSSSKNKSRSPHDCTWCFLSYRGQVICLFLQPALKQQWREQRCKTYITRNRISCTVEPAFSLRFNPTSPSYSQLTHFNSQILEWKFSVPDES